jgi:hypothetical protein
MRIGGCGSPYSNALLEMLVQLFLSLSKKFSAIFVTLISIFVFKRGPPHLLIASQSRSGRYGEQMDNLSMPGFELQAFRHVVPRAYVF